VGSHSITAVYNGSAGFLGSTSPAVIVTVTPWSSSGSTVAAPRKRTSAARPHSRRVATDRPTC